MEKNGEKLCRLYQRFHTHTEGKGLGLHLIKGQIEALNGKVESRRGEGSAFKVFFLQPQLTKAVMSTLIKKVLLIDDDPMSNMIHRSLLRKHHWQAETVVFKDGPSALEALQVAIAGSSDSFPEVILLDMEMPAYNGWDFLSAYALLPQSYTSKCLLYLLSSSINPFDIKKAQSYPLIKAYLTKPLTLANLNQIQQDYEALSGQNP